MASSDDDNDETFV